MALETFTSIEYGSCNQKKRKEIDTKLIVISFRISFGPKSIISHDPDRDRDGNKYLVRRTKQRWMK